MPGEPARSGDRVLTTMRAGLGLTVVAIVAPLADLVSTHTLADHVRRTYPGWSQSTVDQDVTAFVVFLVSIGVLGIVCWVGILWAVARGKRWAPRTATTIWLLATLTALYGLAPAGAYDTLLPTVIGVLFLLPCLAGLVAVVQLWTSRVRPRG